MAKSQNPIDEIVREEHRRTGFSAFNPNAGPPPEMVRSYTPQPIEGMSQPQIKARVKLAQAKNRMLRQNRGSKPKRTSY